MDNLKELLLVAREKHNVFNPMHFAGETQLIQSQKYQQEQYNAIMQDVNSRPRNERYLLRAIFCNDLY